MSKAVSIAVRERTASDAVRRLARGCTTVLQTWRPVCKVRCDPCFPPRERWVMRLPFVALGTLALLATVSAAFSVREQAATWRQAGGPGELPAAWRDPHGLPTAWVFLRPGCPHCRDHVQALRRAVAAYPDSVQSRLWSRFVFAGARDAPAGVRVVPDSLRDVFGVRIAPATWWVDAGGSIRRAWRGARAENAWTPELEFLAATAVRVAMP